MKKGGTHWTNQFASLSLQSPTPGPSRKREGGIGVDVPAYSANRHCEEPQARWQSSLLLAPLWIASPGRPGSQ
jgi:hypothetical protein